MTLICTENGCISFQDEDNETAKNELLEQGILKEDVEKLTRFIKEVKSYKLRESEIEK